MNNRFKREVTSFLAHHRDSLTKKSTREFAERQVKELNCTACHVRDETASKWESHLTEIKDLKMAHKDKGHLDQSRPQLTFVGEKLTQNTVHKYLDGSLPYETRDWLLARMPAFPARAEMLAEGLALQHASYGVKDDSKAVSEDIKIGQKLIGANGGFACVICHDAGPQKAMAAFEVKGIDLKHSAERLTNDYYHRWMLNPAHIVPTTKMPKYADDQGKSPMADYDNDAAKQFEAIWQYLKTLQK